MQRTATAGIDGTASRFCEMRLAMISRSLPPTFLVCTRSMRSILWTSSCRRFSSEDRSCTVTPVSAIGGCAAGGGTTIEGAGTTGAGGGASTTGAGAGVVTRGRGGAIAASSASRISRMLPKRSAGFFASARTMTSLIASDRSGLRSFGDTTVPRAWPIMTSSESPTNGSRPTSIS